ncbi:MAG: phosphoesterase [Clostridia bacterium]|nr:phosphoesterase [Clostridia bacterium]
MSPGLIVGLAKLAGLDFIAITDHQTCGNCQAAMAIAEAYDGPVVVPGMEVESSEEIHLLCLFPDLAAAKDLEAQVQASMLPLKNRPEIFGEQHLFNEDDEVVGCEMRLLMQACQLSCDEIARQVLARGGVCIPAHLDREANSMLASLGVVPADFPTDWIELSQRAVPEQFFQQHPDLARYRFLVDSDAHHLAQIDEPGWPVDIQPWSGPVEARLHLLSALRPQSRQ